MDFSKLFSNAAISVTGNVPKAVIKIQDKRSADPAQLETLEAIGPGGISKGGGALTSGMASKANVSSLTGGVTDKLGMNKLNKLNQGGDYNKMFEVQFNPSSMSLTGYHADKVLSQNFNSKTDKELSVEPVHPTLSFSVKLIFDQMDREKAFPGDNFNMSASQALSTAKNLVTSNLTSAGKATSCQVIVEGFLAALRSPETSRVAFCWGEIQYAGFLQGVSANYTLFDASAKPVRAEVDLTILLRDHNVETKETGFDMGYWATSYEKAFTENHSYAGSNGNLSKLGDIGKSVLGSFGF